ncbi:hypothetical protein OsJ_35882 [Oryza sativa Japonica Group]|uniref:Helitron helicase-like domain-containing protein n=1 Tax=Oryza sativa subsp. japonica TaxID=39947 RepID=B9GCU9_ORYSJ|nr:hypothetical protein OsJ_35882 [Oryza sativa Japonica Group]
MCTDDSPQPIQAIYAPLQHKSLLVNRSTKEAVETEEVAIHNRQRQRDAAAASRATAAYPYSRHRSSCAERETGWNLKMPYDDPNQIPCDVEMDETCEASTFGDVHTNEESTFDDLLEDEVVDNYLDNEDDNDDSSKSSKGKKDKFVTAREYYCFRLQVRRGLLNIILFGGRLFQQWAVDMYIKIESMRLDWYSKPENQKKIRAELYQGVVDVLSSGETSGSAVGSKLTTLDEYDKVICAEIPDKAKYPELHRLVIKHMLHGPCGALNRNCACMVDGECRFDFPRQFNQATQQGKNSYPLYRRRDDGWRVKIRGAVLDNRWVVPYNPGLLMRYNCHINVEACASIKSLKYLYKYVYKGHDCASFSVDPSGEINEIQQYRNARYVTPPEAIYRMLGIPLFGIYPVVLQLQLHLPNMQYVTYIEDSNLEDVVNRPSSTRTTLTEYFKMNQVDPKERKLLYKEFPEHYRWITGQNVWQKRKTKRGQVGRVVYAHPADGERYYLRVLLNHVNVATT